MTGPAAVADRRSAGLLLAPLGAWAACAMSPGLVVPDAWLDATCVVLGVAPAFLALGAAAEERVSGRAALGLLALGAACLLAVRGSGLTLAILPAQVLGLVALGHAVGASIGTRIQHPGHVLAASAVAAAADVASVFSPEGPTRAAAEGGLDALAMVAIAAPVPGTREVAPVLGVGDLVMMALYLGAAAAHGLGRARVLGLLAVGLGGAFALSALTGGAVPALVPMAVVVCLGEPAFRRPAARDRRATAMGVAVAVAVIVGVAVRAALAR